MLGDHLHTLDENGIFNLISLVHAGRKSSSSSGNLWRCLRARERRSMASRSSLSYVTGEELVGLQGPKVAVVDVRDEERGYDGHIAGSLHFSSGSFEAKLPELVQELKGKDTVVFHCAKSQVRGPTCARMLCEHLNKAAIDGKLQKIPKVVILERGFNGWAAAGRPICSCQGLVCNNEA